MAYVLGFFAADGNMIKNRRGAHFIAFYSNDKKLLIKIKVLLKASQKISLPLFQYHLLQHSLIQLIYSA